MDENKRKRYEARAKVAKALAHPSRLMIVDLLQHDEKCVNDLTEAVGADQSTVSRHLSILKEAGIVSSRKEGTMIFYRVTCGCLDGFFICLENVLACDLDQRKVALRKKSV
jgi:ArsR family transcriptional regulator